MVKMKNKSPVNTTKHKICIFPKITSIKVHLQNMFIVASGFMPMQTTPKTLHLFVQTKQPFGLIVGASSSVMPGYGIRKETTNHIAQIDLEKKWLSLFKTLDRKTIILVLELIRSS